MRDLPVDVRSTCGCETYLWMRDLPVDGGEQILGGPGSADQVICVDQQVFWRNKYLLLVVGRETKRVPVFHNVQTTINTIQYDILLIQTTIYNPHCYTVLDGTSDNNIVLLAL